MFTWCPPEDSDLPSLLETCEDVDEDGEGDDSGVNVECEGGRGEDGGEGDLDERRHGKQLYCATPSLLLCMNSLQPISEGQRGAEQVTQL